ncbi:MAG: beta/gamma crystallin-related protein [Acidobacteriota bacterium]
MSRWNPLPGRPRACAPILCALAPLVFLTAGPGSAQQDESEKLRIEATSAAVVVYSEPGFRGRSESFTGADRRLDDNRIGNDGPSSVRVPRGCRVTFYEHFDFIGISSVVTQDLEDLGRTRLGRREASSLKVECGPSTRPTDGDPDREIRDRRGALLFSDSGYRGRYHFFKGAVGDLSRHQLGDDAVSSVRVGPGCRVTLYSEPNFKGQATEIRRDLPNLGRTPAGPDTASSLIVECGGADGGGVTLFSDSYFRGERLELRRDVDRLASTKLGDDRVGSVRVSPDCKATLYQNARFGGRSLPLDRDRPTLVGAAVGPDAASSIRVRCRRPSVDDDPPKGELPYGTGAVLYDRSFFQGDGVRIREDVPRLSRLPIGNDRASSIKVAPGCEVRLFRNADFQGRGVLVNGSIEDLDSLPAIGSNELSSIRVRCNSWRR